MVSRSMNGPDVSFSPAMSIKANSSTAEGRKWNDGRNVSETLLLCPILNVYSTFICPLFMLSSFKSITFDYNFFSINLSFF